MAAPAGGTVEIVDVPQHQRYEIRVGGDMVGLADYHLGDGTIDFVHTEIERSRRGTGLGAQLVRAALDDVRSRGRFRVIPTCSYVAAWMEHHPEYSDLLA
jgi:predicted GNAT family acetyltransferase